MVGTQFLNRLVNFPHLRSWFWVSVQVSFFVPIMCCAHWYKPGTSIRGTFKYASSSAILQVINSICLFLNFGNFPIFAFSPHSERGADTFANLIKDAWLIIKFDHWLLLPAGVGWIQSEDLFKLVGYESSTSELLYSLLLNWGNFTPHEQEGWNKRWEGKDW